MTGAAAALMAGAVAAQPGTSSGSAFLVNEAGWLVTNAHVVAGCTEAEVTGHGTAGTVIRDPGADLAALRVEGGIDADPLVLRDAPARLAQRVHALGYPLAGVLSPTVRVTSGTVNARPDADADGHLQISAPIQPGNSGGPVIDDAGRVVGVVVATLAEEAYARAQNVNFAIPADDVAQFLRANGIAFEQHAAGAGSADGELSDRVEAAAAATLAVSCTPQDAVAESLRGEPEIPAPPIDGPMSLAPGHDLLGFDYRMLEDASLEGCRQICMNERRCVGFTFNRRFDACFLKDDALLLVRNEDAVAGAERGRIDDIVVSGLEVHSDTDSPGGDYARLRDADFPQCLLECELEAQCRAFAYVPRTRDCWLKDRVGALVAAPGVEFGRR